MSQINTNQEKVQKPKLSFWQIWNMSFGFLGIQFGFALQNANTSRIFETLGADVENLAFFWLAAPVTGLFIQPIVGYFSDRTWTKLGRRRPYFLVGAILSTIALFFMPNSAGLWMAVGMLWIMDASINISMEPFRAFVGDNLPEEQRTTGFVTQSFFIGIGAVVASMLPWILSNWFGMNGEAAEGVIPDTVKWSYYLGGIVFLLAVLWTVFKSFEYSPEELAKFEGVEHKEEERMQHFSSKEAYYENGTKQLKAGSTIFILSVIAGMFFHSQGLIKSLGLLAALIAILGIAYVIAGLSQRSGNIESGFVTIMNDLQSMPATMKQLAWVQFFTWFGLFAMWIYTTSAVTSHIYGTSDSASKLYNEGADWVGVCFAVYNGVAAIFAFAIPVLAKRTSRKMAHAVCLFIGAIGLLSIFVISNPTLLLVSMIGVGIAWASILSMPYAILTGSIPANKMGYYMGVFNFFIVIPQIVAATILGFLLTSLFGGASIYAMLLGGVSFIIAGLLTFRVEDN